MTIKQCPCCRRQCTTKTAKRLARNEDGLWVNCKCGSTLLIQPVPRHQGGRMRQVLLAVIASIGLIGCAHERTEMDRELALRLVDKAGRIEIVQTGTPLLAVQQPQAAPAQEQGPPVYGESQTCINTPQYSLHGEYIYTAKKCW